MSASTESPSSDVPARHVVWGPAGGLYLLILLAGLAAGLWPDAIRPPKRAPVAAPLPTLQALLVAQTAYFLLVHPLVVARRRPSPLAAVAGCAFLLAAAAPFYLAAGWLADAVWLDGVRCVVLIVLLVPLSLALGAALDRPRVGPVALVAMLLISLAIPAAGYLAAEFTPARKAASALWNLAPLTFAWRTAGSRIDTLFPRPAWAALTWPTAGVIGLLGLVLTCRRTRQPAAGNPA